MNCDRDTIERLKDCPEVERWGLSQNYGSARYGDSVLTVEYADANWMELGKKPSFTGTLPQAAEAARLSNPAMVARWPMKQRSRESSGGEVASATL